MTPPLRLLVWTIDVIAVVAVSHASIAMPSGWLRSAAGGIVVLLLATTVVLIDTTPRNAIRLRPWRSVWVLALLTAALYGHAAVRLPHYAWQATAWVALGSIGFSAMAVSRRVTPWWVAPLWWGPAMVGPVAMPSPGPMIATLAFIGVVASQRPAKD